MKTIINSGKSITLLLVLILAIMGCSKDSLDNDTKYIELLHKKNLLFLVKR